MKKVKVVTLIVIAAFTITGLTVYVNSAFNMESVLTGKKKEMYLAHEAKAKKAEEEAARFKDSDRKPLSPELEKYANEEKISANIHAGLVENVEFPGAQIPMFSIELKAYNFTNRAITLYNLVAAGASAEKPNEGIFANFYTDPKTGESNRNIIQIPNTGKITITGMSEDKQTVTFKTEKGSTGILDFTTDCKGTYKLK